MILIVCLILLAAFALYKRESFEEPDNAFFVAGTCAVLALILSIVLLTDFFESNSLNASRESLMEAYNSTRAGSDEDIAGKVADFNVILSKAKYWRSISVMCWMRSSRWDTMEPIPIKKETP